MVAEIIVGALADQLGLAVPRRVVIRLSAATPAEDANDELADLLQASWGDNLGFEYLERADPIRVAELARIDADWAGQVRWLDWLVLNADRTPASPNLLVRDGRYWLIDHGAALPFHFDWAGVTEDSPTRAERPGHLFAEATPQLEDWDPILTGILTREKLELAAAAVPETFLRPLVPSPGSSESLKRRRSAYVAFLWKRLTAEHHFANSVSPVAS